MDSKFRGSNGKAGAMYVWDWEHNYIAGNGASLLEKKTLEQIWTKSC